MLTHTHSLRVSQCRVFRMAYGSLRSLAISTTEIDTLTRTILSSPDNSSAFQEHIAKNSAIMDASNIANVFFLSAKQGVTLSADQIVLMTPRLQRKQLKLSHRIVAKILYGFRTQSESDRRVLAFLGVLTRKIISTERLVLDAQGVGSCLFGLQGMAGKSSKVRALVSELRHHVDHGPGEMKSQELGNALYGLQNMTSDSAEVRQLLHSLTRRLLACPEELSPQAIGNSFYGLKCMDSSCVEVSLEVLQ